MKMNDYLTPQELAKRWGRNHRTLANWRCESPMRGPTYIKKGHMILYPIQSVVKFEKKNKLLLSRGTPTKQ